MSLALLTLLGSGLAVYLLTLLGNAPASENTRDRAEALRALRTVVPEAEVGDSDVVVAFWSPLSASEDPTRVLPFVVAGYRLGDDRDIVLFWDAKRQKVVRKVTELPADLAQRSPKEVFREFRAWDWTERALMRAAHGLRDVDGGPVVVVDISRVGATGAQVSWTHGPGAGPTVCTGWSLFRGGFWFWYEVSREHMLL